MPLAGLLVPFAGLFFLLAIQTGESSHICLVLLMPLAGILLPLAVAFFLLLIQASEKFY
jgi:hypothetical protein